MIPRPFRMVARVAVAGLLFAAVASSLSAPTAAQQDPPPNETILRNFNIVAFGNEHTGRRYERVRKWAEPVRFGIQVGYDYPDYFEDFVRRQAEDLKSLTGHPIELYYSPKMAKAKKLPKDFNRNNVNVILFYLPKEDVPNAVAKYFDNNPAEVEKMNRTSQCFAKYWTRANEIRRAIVVFPAEEPEPKMRQCVIEELTQLLGLANDSDEVNPSIFNDRSPYIDLTEHDRLMVRLLYDRRIAIGMPREEALRVGRQILAEIRPEREPVPKAASPAAPAR